VALGAESPLSSHQGQTSPLRPFRFPRPDETRPLIVVTPETVIAWRRQGFRLSWRRRSMSRKVGRPRIPREDIAFVRRSEGPRKTQTWHTFIQNHDNGGVFGQFGRHITVEEKGRRRSYRCHLDRWLHQVMGIEGLPIPYGAPNASPHVERFMGTLRQEALDHFIFLGADYIRRVVLEYVRHYNVARPAQAIHGIPDPYPDLKQPPSRETHVPPRLRRWLMAGPHSTAFSRNPWRCLKPWVGCCFLGPVAKILRLYGTFADYGGHGSRSWLTALALLIVCPRTFDF
jgi:hypothetical protein